MKRHYLVLLVVILLLVTLDQASKHVIRTSLSIGDSRHLVPGVLSITHVENTGAAFGSFHGLNAIFIWLSVMALGALLFFHDQLPGKGLARLLPALIIAGLIGNLIDRVMRGAITDFIDFHFWPVFNLADSITCIGVIGLCIAMITDRECNNRNK